MPGFAYSGALLEVGGKTWTYEELNKFLYKPKAYAKNTKMSFAGLKKGEDRAALLAWLRLQSDSPKALPTAGEIATEEADLAPPAPAAPADGTAPVPAEGAVPAPAADAKAPATAAPAPAAPAKH